MFSVFNFSTLTIGIIYGVFLRIDFDVEKNNLVVGVYGVFGLVSYRYNHIGVFFMSLLSLCLNAVIQGDVFVSSGNLFQARVAEGRKE